MRVQILVARGECEHFSLSLHPIQLWDPRSFLCDGYKKVKWKGDADHSPPPSIAHWRYTSTGEGGNVYRFKSIFWILNHVYSSPKQPSNEPHGAPRQ
jgi:hypothetical protein